MENEIDFEKLAMTFGVGENAEDNLALVSEWKQSLWENEAFLRWREGEITQMIVGKLRSAYKNLTFSLINRQPEEVRKATFAKIDALSVILDIMDKNAREEIENIKSEIRRAIQ